MKRSILHSSIWRLRGFTLLEMIITMLIVAVILSVVVVLLERVQRQHARVNQNVQAERESRVLQSVMERDLQHFISQGKYGKLGQQADGSSFVWFLTAKESVVQTNPSKGDFIAVYYGLEQIEVGSHVLPCIVRREMSAELFYQIISQSSDADVVTEFKASSQYGMVALGVVYFQMKAWASKVESADTWDFQLQDKPYGFGMQWSVASPQLQAQCQDKKSWQVDDAILNDEALVKTYKNKILLASSSR